MAKSVPRAATRRAYSASVSRVAAWKRSAGVPAARRVVEAVRIRRVELVEEHAVEAEVDDVLELGQDELAEAG